MTGRGRKLFWTLRGGNKPSLSPSKGLRKGLQDMETKIRKRMGPSGSVLKTNDKSGKGNTRKKGT